MSYRYKGLNEQERQGMKAESMGNGCVKIGVHREDLEDSIGGLSQLKPIMQSLVIKANGKDEQQGLYDARELGKHFDTAITAMTMLLVMMEEKKEDDHESKDSNK